MNTPWTGKSVLWREAYTACLKTSASVHLRIKHCNSEQKNSLMYLLLHICFVNVSGRIYSAASERNTTGIIPGTIMTFRRPAISALLMKESSRKAICTDISSRSVRAFSALLRRCAESFAGIRILRAERNSLFTVQRHVRFPNSSERRNRRLRTKTVLLSNMLPVSMRN